MNAIVRTLYGKGRLLIGNGPIRIPEPALAKKSDGTANRGDAKSRRIAPHLSPRLAYTVSLAFAFLGLEALGLTIFRNHTAMGWAVALGSLVAVDCLNIALCLRRARRAVSLRAHWLLFATSILLNSIALVLRGWVYLHSLFTRHPIPAQLDYTDLILFLDNVPTVILLSLPSGRAYLRFFLWIDAAQTLIIAYLAFIKIFAVIPFTYTALHPIPGDTLIAIYNIEDLIFCGAITVRFLAATSQDEKRFYRLYWWYTLVDSILIALYNEMAAKLVYASYYELLGVAPVLFCSILMCHQPAESAETAKVQSSNSLADFLNIVSPAFFTVVLLALSFGAARHFFVFGMSTLAAAFLLHAIRAAALQRNYEIAQRSLRQAGDRLEALSMTDPLTGVANRRSLDQTLEVEWARATLASQPLSLLMIDVDYFKALNDRYGHQNGDHCLVQVAQALRAVLSRRGDLVARYGGEEFCVVLPATDRSGAVAVARNMQRAVEGLRIENPTAIGPHATISIGVATAGVAQGLTAQFLQHEADRALYRAKQEGRNRIEVSDAPVIQ